MTSNYVLHHCATCARITEHVKALVGHRVELACDVCGEVTSPEPVEVTR